MIQNQLKSNRDQLDSCTGDFVAQIVDQKQKAEAYFDVIAPMDLERVASHFEWPKNATGSDRILCLAAGSYSSIILITNINILFKL